MLELILYYAVIVALIIVAVEWMCWFLGEKND
jgi:hypothetical protein